MFDLSSGHPWANIDLRDPGVDLLDDSLVLVAEDKVGLGRGWASYMRRSEPQILVVVSRITASFGTSIFGSGFFSTVIL